MFSGGAEVQHWLKIGSTIDFFLNVKLIRGEIIRVSLKTLLPPLLHPPSQKSAEYFLETWNLAQK